MNINSYPSIFAVGHRFIKELFRDPVVVQEKVDGSQFSFMRVDGELYCRSPRDIGRLMAEIPVDIKEDSEEDIKETLFKHFWPQIKRGVTSGFPEFYKRELGIINE